VGGGGGNTNVCPGGKYPRAATELSDPETHDDIDNIGVTDILRYVDYVDQSLGLNYTHLARAASLVYALSLLLLLLLTSPYGDFRD